MRAHLEAAMNVATVIVLASVVAVLGTRYLTNGNAKVRISAAAGIEFAKAPRTLVIVVQEECAFCTTSMPFYRRLTKGKRKELQIVVAAPARSVNIRAYLLEHQVLPDRVVLVSGQALPVQTTPTLFAVNSKGEILARWDGALSAEREQQVVSFLHIQS